MQETKKQPEKMEVEEDEDLTWKNKGNAAYKKKNFDEAI